MSEEKQEQKQEALENATDFVSPAMEDDLDDATVVMSLQPAVSSVKVENKSDSEPAETVTNVPEDLTVHESNKLMNLATPILVIIADLRRSQQNIELSKLRQRLSQEISSFDVKSKNQGIDESTILLTRYVLCAVADEFVLDTPWGANSNWSEFSLLNTFHQDSAGGEKFFAILDKIQQDTLKNLELLELMYQCLALGFVGRYRIMMGGKQQLLEIKQRLFQQIKNQRGQRDQALSIDVKTLVPEEVNTVKRIPFLKLGKQLLIVLLIIFIGFGLSVHIKGTKTVSVVKKELTYSNSSQTGADS